VPKHVCEIYNLGSIYILWGQACLVCAIDLNFYSAALVYIGGSKCCVLDFLASPFTITLSLPFSVLSFVVPFFYSYGFHL
jgi:hypothetical protein